MSVTSSAKGTEGAFFRSSGSVFGEVDQTHAGYVDSSCRRLLPHAYGGLAGLRREAHDAMMSLAVNPVLQVE